MEQEVSQSWKLLGCAGAFLLNEDTHSRSNTHISNLSVMRITVLRPSTTQNPYLKSQKSIMEGQLDSKLKVISGRTRYVLSLSDNSIQIWYVVTVEYEQSISLYLLLVVIYIYME